MSFVTNVILTFDSGDEKLFPEVNKFFEETCGFKEISEHAGGTKYLEICVAVGAFNYLVLDDLIGYIHRIKWEYPENVQLFVCEQEDERFKKRELK